MPRCCATILDTNPVGANPAVANPAVAGGKNQDDPAVLIYCEAFHPDDQTANDAAVDGAKAAFARMFPGVPVPEPEPDEKPGRLKKSQLNSF